MADKVKQRNIDLADPGAMPAEGPVGSDPRAAAEAAGEADRKGAAAELALLRGEADDGIEAPLAGEARAALGPDDKLSRMPTTVQRRISAFLGGPKGRLSAVATMWNEDISDSAIARSGRRSVSSKEDMEELAREDSLARVVSATEHLTIEAWKGRNIDEVIRFVGKFTNLEALVIDFSKTRWSAENLANLKESLSKLKNLRRLRIDLSGTNFRDDGGAMSEALGQLEDLEVLSMKLDSESGMRENISLGGCPVLTALRSFPKLRSLTLSMKNIFLVDSEMDSFCGSLSAIRKNLDTLNLNLSRAFIDGGMEKISKVLPGFSNLSVARINLSFGHMGGFIDPSPLFEAFGSLSNLRVLRLDLKRNLKVARCLEYFPAVFTSNKGLEDVTLGLDGTGCTVPGLQDVGAALWRLPKLDKLLLILPDLRGDCKTRPELLKFLAKNFNGRS